MTMERGSNSDVQTKKAQTKHAIVEKSEKSATEIESALLKIKAIRNKVQAELDASVSVLDETRKVSSDISNSLIQRELHKKKKNRHQHLLKLAANALVIRNRSGGGSSGDAIIEKQCQYVHVRMCGTKEYCPLSKDDEHSMKVIFGGKSDSGSNWWPIVPDEEWPFERLEKWFKKTYGKNFKLRANGKGGKFARVKPNPAKVTVELMRKSLPGLSLENGEKISKGMEVFTGVIKDAHQGELGRQPTEGELTKVYLGSWYQEKTDPEYVFHPTVSEATNGEDSEVEAES